MELKRSLFYILLIASLAGNGILIHKILQERSLKKELADAIFLYNPEQGINALKQLIDFERISIKDFIAKMDLKAQTCGAAVSTQERPFFAGQPIFDFACLIKGHRSVI